MTDSDALPGPSAFAGKLNSEPLYGPVRFFVGPIQHAFGAPPCEYTLAGQAFPPYVNDEVWRLNTMAITCPFVYALVKSRLPSDESSTPAGRPVPAVNVKLKPSAGLVSFHAIAKLILAVVAVMARSPWV